MYHTGGLCVHVVILGELLKSPVFQRSDDPIRGVVCRTINQYPGFLWVYLRYGI
jgi:hypothetical protein